MHIDILIIYDISMSMRMQESRNMIGRFFVKKKKKTRLGNFGTRFKVTVLGPRDCGKRLSQNSNYFFLYYKVIIRGVQARA